jgi:Bacteriophage minor capsid protein
MTVPQPTPPLFEHSPADILTQLLIDRGLVTTTSPQRWQGFVDYMPDDETIHDDIVAVFNTSGIKDGRLMQSGKSIEHPGWQIRVRSLSPTAGLVYLKLIGDHLDVVYLETVTLDVAVDDISVKRVRYRIESVQKTGTVLALGVDNKDRKRRRSCTLNGMMTVRVLDFSFISI